MPYISTKTNIELAKEKQDALAAEYGRIISLPRKDRALAHALV